MAMTHPASGTSQTDHPADTVGVRAGRISDPIDRMLADLRVVSADDLYRAWRRGLAYGVPARAVLAASGTITQDDLAEAVSRATGLPRGTLAGQRSDETVLERLEESWTREHRALPLRIENRSLLVAVVEPLDREAEESLHLRYGAIESVTQFVVTTTELDRARLETYRDYYLYEALHRADDENLDCVDGADGTGRGFPRRMVGDAAGYGFEPVLPAYTLLLPIGPDLAAATQVVQAARSVDYPPHLLDVKLLCMESVDRASTLSGLLLPPHLHLVPVPDRLPPTVAALHNYGLAMADGDITVAYDAGQLPAPDHLRRAVRAFADSRRPPSLARVTLRSGWARALTTHHYRTAALRAVGGWRLATC